jgi:hypothetical protein
MTRAPAREKHLAERTHAIGGRILRAGEQHRPPGDLQDALAGQHPLIPKVENAIGKRARAVRENDHAVREHGAGPIGQETPPGDRNQPADREKNALAGCDHALYGCDDLASRRETVCAERERLSDDRKNHLRGLALGRSGNFKVSLTRKFVARTRIAEPRGSFGETFRRVMVSFNCLT